MKDVLAQTYPSRIEALEQLVAANDGDALRTSAKKLDAAADIYARAASNADWRALAQALEILALLVDWEDAARTAAPDADRFLRAARLKYTDWAAAPDRPFASALTACLAPVADDLSPLDVTPLREAVAAVPMPVALFAEPEIRYPFDRPTVAEKVDPEDVTVAFLEFKIDGQPAETLHALSAGQLHDLDIFIRVSSWPDHAERLVIAPLSVEPPSSWDFPSFEFLKPDGPPPYNFGRKGRMALHMGQGFNARPLEFRYAATFHPEPDWDQTVVVAGQRTLLLDGTDTSRPSITGYPEIDARIRALRNELRRHPQIAESDLLNLLTLLTPIGNLMGQAVQDKRYPDPIDEAAFQKDFQSFLRSQAAIGAELEVQPQLAGGRVDLSFRGIGMELKAERQKRLMPDDCRQYAQQAASYAVGAGKRVAILCVLDSSRKQGMAFPAGDGLNILSVDTGTSPVHVVCCLIQGGFARPSDLSR